MPRWKSLLGDDYLKGWWPRKQPDWMSDQGLQPGRTLERWCPSKDQYQLQYYRRHVALRSVNAERD